METGSVASNGSRRLEGWQEIADRLGVSPRQAQTWRKDLGLPVHGGRPHRLRVWAWSHELDRWRETRRKDPEPAANLELTPPVVRKRLPAARTVAGIVIAALFAVALILYQMRTGHKETENAWQLQPIRSIEFDRETIWRGGWKDIAWISEDEGWLCGETVSGGPTGDLGTGILLHTTNRGVSWTRIEAERFHSGSGVFHWGDNRQAWRDIGPIYAMQVSNRDPREGSRRAALWLAATTGMYYSADDGETWKRSTPPPDDPKYPIPFAHFGNLFHIIATDEIYTAGWQGLSYWSAGTSRWELQFPTVSYVVSAVFVYPDENARPDVWAVGAPATGDTHPSIYHLQRPEQRWERMSLPGIEVDPSQGGLKDLILVDNKTVFAVGPNGLIVKGEKGASGGWLWNSLRRPTNRALFSICYAAHKLWIAGDDGTVLISEDLGQSWERIALKDDSGAAPTLYRIRFIGDSLWITGRHAVYRRRLAITR